VDARGRHGADLEVQVGAAGGDERAQGIVQIGHGAQLIGAPKSFVNR
jgi:hypothetical protein